MTIELKIEVHIKRTVIKTFLIYKNVSGKKFKTEIRNYEGIVIRRNLKMKQYRTAKKINLEIEYYK